MVRRLIIQQSSNRRRFFYQTLYMNPPIKKMQTTKMFGTVLCKILEFCFRSYNPPEISICRVISRTGCMSTAPRPSLTSRPQMKIIEIFQHFNCFVITCPVVLWRRRVIKVSLVEGIAHYTNEMLWSVCQVDRASPSSSSQHLQILHLQQRIHGAASSKNGEATRSRTPKPAKIPTTWKQNEIHEDDIVNL